MKYLKVDFFILNKKMIEIRLKIAKLWTLVWTWSDSRRAIRARCKVLLRAAADFNMGNHYYGGFWFIIKKKTTKAIAMKLSIISFGPNSRIVAKFQTDPFRTFRENRAEKNKEITPSKP